MLRFILLILLLASCASAWAQSADDADFKKEMAEYTKRLKAVKTRAEGQKILAEMMARQQSYLAKKTDTVTQIKNRYGVAEKVAAAKQINFSSGNARYEDNPLFTKYKVTFSFTTSKTDSRTDSKLHTAGASTYSSTGKGTIHTYLSHNVGRYMLAGGDDGIISATASGGISASGTDKSPQASSSYMENASGVAKPLPIVAFSYEDDKHWSATGRVHFSGTRTDKRGAVKVETDEGGDADQDNATIVHNGATFTITRTISEHQNVSHGSISQREEVSGTFSMTITPDKPEKYVAYFEPVGGQQAYEQWMPEGYSETPRQHGNFIDIRISMERTSEPGKDLTKEARYIKWELPADEVSRVIGYANNAPQKTDFTRKQNPPDKRSTIADMQLRLTTQLADTSVEILKATSDTESSYTIRVYAFDYGAFSRLTAHVVLADSTEIIASDRASGKPFLLLPKREGDSKVATYFKQMSKALDKKDEADDEQMPGGDRYPGDGFSLYEEYRGFMENGKHFRGDPKAKDVMIYDGINTARSRDGISTYELVLNDYTGHVVKTHHKFREEEFGVERDYCTETERDCLFTYGVVPLSETRCLNYNNLPALHLVDQHGICIMKTEKKLGFALASPNVGGLCGPPVNYDMLVISADFKDDSTGWSRTRADVDSNGNITVNPNGASLIITDEYARTLAHEMLHYTGVNHHGDNGEFNNTAPSTFEYIGHSLWRLDGRRAVKLFWETAPGVPIDTLDARFMNLLRGHRGHLTINIWHGTSSGFEDCIMRYDNPDGYAKAAASMEVYIIPQREQYGELSGTKLCTSPKGTGVNDANHQPMSRYSDADDGRGNCISQFCVNDKYAH